MTNHMNKQHTKIRTKQRPHDQIEEGLGPQEQQDEEVEGELHGDVGELPVVGLLGADEEGAVRKGFGL